MAERKQSLPPTLEPVLAFLNTVDVELGTDEFASGPEALSAWLTANGLLVDRATASQAEHRLALRLRSGLRALALANNGGSTDEAAMRDLARTLRRFPLVACPPGDDGPALVPDETRPLLAALGRIVVGYAIGVATGEWRRVRLCPAADCAWGFWDSSAKGARRWCKMGVCGNRAKVRAFAERRKRHGATSQNSPDG